MKPCQGSLRSETLCSVEPEENFKPFEPFEPEPADVVRTYNSSSSDAVNKDSMLNPNNPSSSSQGVFGNTEFPESGENRTESPHRSPDPGPSVGFRAGVFKQPSLTNRLSCVDRKWLERCQVFGEMEAEERPGGGNQEFKTEQRKERDEERAGRVERAEGEEGSDDAQQRTRKSKAEGGRKEKTNKEEEIEGGQAWPTAPEDNSESPKSQSAKKRGRKRQREGGDVEGSGTEEEGVKKRRKSCKKKEESCANSNDGGGEKKRRAKRKEKEHDKEEETKVPTKVRDVIILNIITYKSYLFIKGLIFCHLQ